MNIYLGNLGVSQIEKRIGFDFPQELRDFMKNTRQHKAENIQNGHWHCFDMPFMLCCGDRETAQKIYDQLTPFSSEAKEKLQISINKG